MSSQDPLFQMIEEAEQNAWTATASVVSAVAGGTLMASGNWTLRYSVNERLRLFVGRVSLTGTTVNAGAVASETSPALVPATYRPSPVLTVPASVLNGGAGQHVGTKIDTGVNHQAIIYEGIAGAFRLHLLESVANIGLRPIAAMDATIRNLVLSTSEALFVWKY